MINGLYNTEQPNFQTNSLVTRDSRHEFEPESKSKYVIDKVLITWKFL